MNLALALLLLASRSQAPARAQIEEAADTPAAEAAAAVRTRFAGRVLGPGGAPVPGAEVVTSAGGRAESAADGRFELEVDVPANAVCVDVTAVADVGGARGSQAASARVVPPALAPFAEVGALVLGPVPGCAPRWLPTFGASPGADDDVRALAVLDDGRGPALFAGGTFLSVGGVRADLVARWSDGRWAPLGAGLSGSFAAVEALAVFDDGQGPALYAAGSFSGAGGAPASCVASWDGTRWSALGSGLDLVPSVAYALSVFDDGSGPALFVGGQFAGAGGVPTSSIARWNGQAWSPLGSGVAGSALTIYALAVFDDGSGPALYAGGQFTSAGGVSASNVARWDGSTWSALGGGVDGGVRALCVFDDGGGPALYAGGGFTHAGGASANRIAKWDGSSWAPLGVGTDSVVMDLEVLDDGGGPALHASGAFTVAGGAPAPGHVARWNGTSWSAPATGPGGVVNALAVLDEGGGPRLHAAGDFETAGGAPAWRIARFDGPGWSALGRGLTGSVSALAVGQLSGDEELFVGGVESANGASLNGIGRWDGSDWAALGSGMSGGAVQALAFFDDGRGGALYAGGSFSSAGGAVASRIARWDGAAWSALGSGVDGTIKALAVFDDGRGPALYAGGSFTHAGGVGANRIARWDGTSWSALGAGLGGGSGAEVRALAVFDDGGGPALYVGGTFTTAGGAPARRIARWDGASWSAVGPVLYGGAIEVLAVVDVGGGPALYAGGRFLSAEGVALDRIARWNGSGWTPLGGGTDGPVFDLAVFDDGGGPALYLGGSFAVAGGVAASGLARWDGSSWSALGAGVNVPSGSGSVAALAVFDDGHGPALCAGGAFTISPARDSALARWGCARRFGHASR